MKFLLKIVSFIVSLFTKENKEFKALKDDPRNPETHQALAELYKNKPVEFVKCFIINLLKLSNTKEETQEPGGDFGKMRETWENTIHKEKVQPLLYEIPTSKEELVSIIKDAEAKGRLVRAVGKGHSYSDVANATDVLVDMLGLDKVVSLEEDTFTDTAKAETLFSCEGGMLVEQLNAELDKRNLSVTTMAAFDQETIYGAIATSTHGTGIRVYGMSEMLQSMDLVAANGQCYRLEPKNGITDPTKFNAKYPNGEITLIQDDDKFRSATVGFGLMGIVYSVVLKVRPMYYLKQRLWLTSWSKVKPKLENGDFFLEIDAKGTKVEKDPVTGEYLPTRAQVFVNPYKTKKFWSDEEDHTCVVQVQTEISKEEFEKLKAKEQKHKQIKIFEFIESILSNGSHGIHIETIEEEDKESVLEEIGVEVLGSFMNIYPELSPLVLEISLLILLSGSGKIGKGYVVMNQGKLAVKNAGYSVEPGFAVDQNYNFISGAEEIMATLASTKDALGYQSAPMCLRFVKQSDDYMSPEYGVDTCMIEVPMLLGTIGDDQMLDRMQRNLLAKGARPHWGKICNMVNTRELITEMYPQFDKFLDTVAFFNPNNTFNGTFSYRTGISKMIYNRNKE